MTIVANAPSWQTAHERFESLKNHSYERHGEGWSEYRHVSATSKPGHIRVVHIAEASRHGRAVNKPHRPLEAKLEFCERDEGLSLALTHGYADEQPRESERILKTVDEEKFIDLLTQALKRKLPLAKLLHVIEKLQ
ncbi:MAG: hypothetical protein ACOC00_03480 [Halothiobacillaceae bacterium]